MCVNSRGAQLNPHPRVRPWTVISMALLVIAPVGAAIGGKSLSPLRLRPVPHQVIVAVVASAPEGTETRAAGIACRLGRGSPIVASENTRSGVLEWSTSTETDLGEHTGSLLTDDGRDRRAETTVGASAAWPAPVRGKTLVIDLGEGAHLELVPILAGSFTMGDDRVVEEKPAHKVRISRPFYLGKHKVTQQQWQCLVKDDPSHFRRPGNPVDRANWDDCQQFLAKLNERFPAHGGIFRLPTEAEWEYACRAGSRTKWFFGDDDAKLGDYAWFKDNSGGQTHLVGKKLPNEWGLYDMLGDVAEWCGDWYASNYYADSPPVDPRGPKTGRQKVVRGAAWGSSAWYCRSSCRGSRRKSDRGFAELGFRVALEPHPDQGREAK